MRFARNRPFVARSLQEAVDQTQLLADYRVRVCDINWREGKPELSFRTTGWLRHCCRWGGDAYTHLVKDLGLRERDPHSIVVLRVASGVVVGGLTPEYRSVTNFQVLSTLNSLSLNLRLAKISPSYSFFFATPFEGPRDAYVPAVRVINSETGYRTLTVETGLMKLVCQNGLIVVEQNTGSMLQSLHRAGSLPENFDLREEIRTRLQQSFENYRLRLANAQFSRHGTEAVRLWVRQEFGARQARQVLSDLDATAQTPNSYRRSDIIDAVTRLHQTFPRSADRWQTLGGELLQPDYFDRYFSTNPTAGAPQQARQPIFEPVGLPPSPVRLTLVGNLPQAAQPAQRSSYDRDANEPLHGPALEEARRIEREFNEAFQREQQVEQSGSALSQITQLMEAQFREQRTDPLLLAREEVERQRLASRRREVEARIRGYLR